MHARAPRGSGLGERAIEAVLSACGLVTILTTLGILGVLLFESLAFFREIGLSRLIFDTQWTPLFADKHFGIWPLLAGTVLTSLIAIAVGLPFGLLSAIYLSEFASPGLRKVAKPALELLAGVPTVVFGYFALVIVTPLLQVLMPDLSGFNALSAGLVMGLMIVPLISSLSEDALWAVPRGLREGAWALGAGKVETIVSVVLPGAKSGLFAALTLAISRAIGETMIVAIAAGQQPRLTLDPRSPVETMTAYIVQISMGDVPVDSLEYRTIFAVGAALFLLTFGLNLIGRRFVPKSQRSR